MSKKILITGGTGYLGGRIAEFLAKQSGVEVIVTSRNGGSKSSFLEKCTVVSLDLLNDSSIKDICKGIDTVIHLAALNEIESAESPQKALLVNGLGTLKLLEEAEKNGVRRFIYLSTAHIYKAPLIGIITEETLPYPTHPYAISHKVAEDFVLAAHQHKKIQGIVVRLSNGFGCPISADVNRWSLVVNDLCRQAVTDKKLALKSSGLQSRDFITLTDVARAMDHFISLPVDEIGNGIFNLGGENPARIIDMTNIIAERCKLLFGFTPPISRPAAHETETVPPLIDFRIDKLRSTGFQLAGNINEEIDNTLILCSQSLNKSNA